MNKKYSIIRTHSAGVWMGVIKTLNGSSLLLPKPVDYGIGVALLL